MQVWQERCERGAGAVANVEAVADAEWGARGRGGKVRSNSEGGETKVSSPASCAHPYLYFRALGPSCSPALAPWSVHRPSPGARPSSVAWIRTSHTDLTRGPEEGTAPTQWCANYGATRRAAHDEGSSATRSCDAGCKRARCIICGKISCVRRYIQAGLLAFYTARNLRTRNIRILPVACACTGEDGVQKYAWAGVRSALHHCRTQTMGGRRPGIHRAARYCFYDVLLRFECTLQECAAKYNITFTANARRGTACANLQTHTVPRISRHRTPSELASIQQGRSPRLPVSYAGWATHSAPAPSQRTPFSSAETRLCPPVCAISQPKICMGPACVHKGDSAVGACPSRVQGFLPQTT